MPARGAHADPPAHAVRRTDPARRPRADPPAAKGLRIQKDLQRAIPLRALCPDPRTAPGPHKDKKGAGPARDADQTAPPDNAPRRGEARRGRPPCGARSPHDAGRGPYAPQRRSARPASWGEQAPQGGSPAGLSASWGIVWRGGLMKASFRVPGARPTAAHARHPPIAVPGARPEGRPCRAVLRSGAARLLGSALYALRVISSGASDGYICAMGGLRPAFFRYAPLPDSDFCWSLKALMRTIISKLYTVHWRNAGVGDCASR